MKGKHYATTKISAKSLTSFLFITTQVFALGWVSISYLMAAYSTLILGQPYPVETISQQAIESLLGISALKVLGNIFEHNDGGIFGQSNSTENSYLEDDFNG